MRLMGINNCINIFVLIKIFLKYTHILTLSLYFFYSFVLSDSRKCFCYWHCWRFVMQSSSILFFLFIIIHKLRVAIIVRVRFYLWRFIRLFFMATLFIGLDHSFYRIGLMNYLNYKFIIILTVILKNIIDTIKYK